MNQLSEWARRHGVSPAAMAELGNLLSPPHIEPGVGTLHSESHNSSKCRLVYSQRGDILWRNNVGQATAITGQPVRYGLCNESAKINKVVKSSDLIGITTVEITQAMVGQLVGIFTAVEMKASGWKLRPNDAHTRAQWTFINRVRCAGGIAGFCNNGRGEITL